MVHLCPFLSETDMAKTGFYQLFWRSTILNQKIIFNVHQFYAVVSIMIDYNQLDYCDFFWISWLSTGLKSFHRKYSRSYVVSFICGSLAEINMEIFAAIVKLVMLFLCNYFSPISQTTQPYWLKYMVCRHIW